MSIDLIPAVIAEVTAQWKAAHVELDRCVRALGAAKGTPDFERCKEALENQERRVDELAHRLDRMREW